MAVATLNRISFAVMTTLALVALATVGTGFLPGHVPQADEGTAAHIFQLSVVVAGLAGLTFLMTADWAQPARHARRLALPAAALVLAFAALYYLEHVFYPRYY